MLDFGIWTNERWAPSWTLSPEGNLVMAIPQGKADQLRLEDGKAQDVVSTLSIVFYNQGPEKHRETM